MQYPIYRPYLTELEKKYVNDCLDSTWISSKGKYIYEFEEKISSYTGARHAISVSNGTVALHLALWALGLDAKTEVIVPDFTYIASANAVKYVGAKIKLVDVDINTWNIDLNKLLEKISPDTKAIMITNIYGHPVDISKIRTEIERRGIRIIEDAAESFGATIRNQKSGNIGDIATFSFFGNKTITTGEGGMVLTNDDSVAERASIIHNQGNSKERSYFHEILGHNFRMTNIQAALGCAQMENLNYILEKKRQIFSWYYNYLKEFVKFQVEEKESNPSYWMISFLVENEKKRALLQERLAKKGIETRPFFSPISDMPFYDSCDTPNAHYLSGHGINVPSYPELEKEDVNFICNQIKDILAKEL